MSVHENETTSNDLQFKHITTELTADVAEVHITVRLWREIVEAGNCKGIPMLSKKDVVQRAMLTAKQQEYEDLCRLDDKAGCPGFQNEECVLCCRMVKFYSKEGVCKARTCSLGGAIKDSNWVSMVDTIEEKIGHPAFEQLFQDEVDQ